MADKSEIEQVELEISEATQDLIDKLQKIDPNLIVQLTVGRPNKFPGDFDASSWPDNWHDGTRWVKSFGKSSAKHDFDFEIGDFEGKFRGLKD